ncbi:MAG: Ribonuclease Z [Promethearchaeota archaeon]|nr:MAG: Ribonuclease Z [Candidatus Lokiarchaeota archaeon]
MELTILGSSAAAPVRERNLSAIVLRYRNNLILFDCGEDTQRRFIEAGIKLNKPLIICLSHFHADHVIGLPGLLFRFVLVERDASLTIIGPKNLFLYLYLHKKILGLRTEYPLTIYEIDQENQTLLQYDGLDSPLPSTTIPIQDQIIYEKKRYSIKYTPVNHSVNSFAYAFIEKPRYGRFHPEKARELGIPESNLWKTLQQGHTINYKGKEIDPLKEGIVDEQRPGRKITYSGDTKPCESLIELGMNSDILIHESTFSKTLSNVAHEKLHSTAEDAAQDAQKMNAKKLILTHISARYQDEAQELLDEAKKIFPDVVLAQDLMSFTIK